MANTAVWTKKEGESETSLAVHVGDTVRVHYKLIEKEKVAGKQKREVHEETRERLQVFEGIIIGIKGSGINTMMTVRHMSPGGLGVERIFPVSSPWIRKLEIKKLGRVRRAKLYYLRGRTGKAATRIHEAKAASAPPAPGK